MTATTLLIQRAARAVEEAFELAETLDPGNETLQRAKNEPLRDNAHAIPELLAGLAGICHRQQGQIKELAEKIEALESGAASSSVPDPS